MAATHFLPLLIGQQAAAKLLLTGDLISGDEAARIGLVLVIHNLFFNSR